MQSTAAASAGALALGGASTAAGQSKVQESCVGEYETFEVGDGGSWNLMNNLWGMPDSEQCIWVNDDGSYGYNFSAVGDGINYPEVFCGGRPWGSDTGIPELPGRRGDIEEFVLEWDVDVNISGGEWDLAEEWWMVEGQTGESPALTHEIMLVLDWGGGHGHYMEEQNVWTDQFGNQIDYWAHYGEGGTDADFHIFRINGGASTGKVDLKEIIDFMNERHGVSEELTLTGVEVGNEYWAGAEGEVTYNALNLVVNGSVYTSGPGGRIGETGPDPQPEPPTSPDDAWTNDVTTSTIEVGWSDVANADEYTVYLDGNYETTTSSTSATITGLSPETSYTVGIEASNEDGTSEMVETTVTTDAAEVGACEEAGSESETLSNGHTVCVDNGVAYDVNGDGSVSNSDVTEFFSNQHADPWDSRDDLFDFNSDGEVSQADVIELFQYVN